MVRGFLGLVVFWGMLSCAQAYTPVAGDIVFHTSTSAQSAAIQAATRSPYSHVGMVLFNHGKPVVLEAVQPVKYTPLDRWLRRGKAGHYVVKRLKSPISVDGVAKLTLEAQRYIGKPYDLTFEWSDNRMYCSELVWKLYKSALGIELSPLSRLGSFDLTSPVVKAKLKERYGQHIPMDEPVIAPSALLDSSLLITVEQR